MTDKAEQALNTFARVIMINTPSRYRRIRSLKIFNILFIPVYIKNEPTHHYILGRQKTEILKGFQT